jgi:hypothetical protein
MDEWDWDREEIVDLDGYEASGDPQVDILGYNSPKQRTGTGFTDNGGELRAHWRTRLDAEAAKRKAERRQAVEANVAERRRKVAERRGEPQPVAPDLAPHVAQAVAAGMANRDLGWWRVDVDAYGRAVWTRVDAPGDGTTMTVEQTPAQPVQPQWHPVQRWVPAELTEPSPGTRVW